MSEASNMAEQARKHSGELLYELKRMVFACGRCGGTGKKSPFNFSEDRECTLCSPSRKLIALIEAAK